MISSEVSDFTTFCGHANSRSQNVIEGTLRLWFEKHWRSSKIANNFSSFPHKFIAILWEEKNHRWHASRWSSNFFMLVDAIFCPIKRTLQIHMYIDFYQRSCVCHLHCAANIHFMVNMSTAEYSILPCLHNY